jgi:hypothetical protein
MSLQQSQLCQAFMHETKQDAYCDWMRVLMCWQIEMTYIEEPLLAALEARRRRAYEGPE